MTSCQSILFFLGHLFVFFFSELAKTLLPVSCHTLFIFTFSAYRKKLISYWDTTNPSILRIPSVIYLFASLVHIPHSVTVISSMFSVSSLSPLLLSLSFCRFMVTLSETQNNDRMDELSVFPSWCLSGHNQWLMTLWQITHCHLYLPFVLF